MEPIDDHNLNFLLVYFFYVINQCGMSFGRLISVSRRTVLFSDYCYYFAVVYLDADTIVVKSIEDLFKCGKFCANLKHSERLNSGVMVVEPSETVFNDMMSKVKTLPSYTGGKVFFRNVINTPYFLYC